MNVHLRVALFILPTQLTFIRWSTPLPAAGFTLFDRRTRIQAASGGHLLTHGSLRFACWWVVFCLWATASNAVASVWILDNANSELWTEPFNDTLTLLGPSGGVVAKLGELGIQQTYGAHREIAVGPGGGFLIAAQDLKSAIERYEADGSLSWSLTVEGKEEPSAVDVSTNGYAYVLVYRERVTGDRLLKVDASDGRVVDSSDIRGFDLVVDDARGNLWVVGQQIQKVTADMDVQCALSVPDRTNSMSVDFASDGSIWTGFGPYTDEPQLWNVSPSCSLERVVDLPYKPAGIRVDRNDDSVWVASGAVGETGLYKYDRNGDLIRTVSREPTWGIDIDRTDGSVWSADLGTGYIRHYSAAGDLMQSIDGFSTDQKYVAVLDDEPSVLGDFNANGMLDPEDIDMLAGDKPDPSLDLTGDGMVNRDDRVYWVHELAGSWFGDANLDGEFNSSDLVAVFTKGKYETGSQAGWREGDWNSDRLFTTTDFVVAFSDGGYGLVPAAVASAIPEPASFAPLLAGAFGIVLGWRRGCRAPRHQDA